MTSGRFVVLEGLDGAGTSTQIELLAAWLRQRGVEVQTTREPTGGAIGRLIREVLTGVTDVSPAALALLFAADRVDHLETTADGIKSVLAAGGWVLSDRYVLSSIAYQAADGLDAEWVATINRRAITPDATLFVDTTPEECMRRIAARGGKPERFENLVRLELVRTQFVAHLGRTELTGRLLTIDGDDDIDAVAEGIRTAIEGWLAESQ